VGERSFELLIKSPPSFLWAVKKIVGTIFLGCKGALANGDTFFAWFGFYDFSRVRGKNMDCIEQFPYLSVNKLIISYR
jgi:hypothetical protein